MTDTGQTVIAALIEDLRTAASASDAGRSFVGTRCLAAAEALTASLSREAALVEATTWQPAETAPKDGTQILAHGGVYSGVPFVVCYAPSEFNPSEPWVVHTNRHRLPAHCVERWMSIPALKSPAA